MLQFLLDYIYNNRKQYDAIFVIRKFQNNNKNQTKEFLNKGDSFKIGAFTDCNWSPYWSGSGGIILPIFILLS